MKEQSIFDHTEQFIKLDGWQRLFMMAKRLKILVTSSESFKKHKLLIYSTRGLPFKNLGVLLLSIIFYIRFRSFVLILFYPNLYFHPINKVKSHKTVRNFHFHFTDSEVEHSNILKIQRYDSISLLLNAFSYLNFHNNNKSKMHKNTRLKVSHTSTI